MRLPTYDLYLFDCDGVLLDSNSMKTEAFRTVAGRHGADAAEALVAFHVENGGVSRYVKFRHLHECILRTPTHLREEEVARDCVAFAKLVRTGLATCHELPGVRELLGELPGSAQRHVVSGSDQAELRDVFRERGLREFFQEVHGSPACKREHIARVLEEAGSRRAILFGDSRGDHLAALEAGIDFVFVYSASEFLGWEEYFRVYPVVIVPDLRALLSC